MGVQLWDLSTGAEGKRRRGPTDNISGVAVSPDGQSVAAASADKMVWLWQREPGQPVSAVCIKGHTAAVTGVAFVAADSLLSSSHDGTVRQWDLKTGKSKGVLQAPVGPIGSMEVRSVTSNPATSVTISTSAGMPGRSVTVCPGSITARPRSPAATVR